MGKNILNKLMNNSNGMSLLGDVKGTSEDVFKIIMYLLNLILETFPALGKLILLIIKTSVKITKDTSSLLPYIGSASLLIPYFVIITLINYVINIVGKEEHKNKMIDDIFLS